MKRIAKVTPPACACKHTPRDTKLCPSCGHFHPLQQTVGRIGTEAPTEELAVNLSLTNYQLST